MIAKGAEDELDVASILLDLMLVLASGAGTPAGALCHPVGIARRRRQQGMRIVRPTPPNT